MGDIRGVGGTADVVFDFGAAADLAMHLRVSAEYLRMQAPGRRTLADQAREEWRGLYADLFNLRMTQSTSDAELLAAAMVKAAEQVAELIRLAHAENARRRRVREWKQAHDAWQQRQDQKGFIERNFTWGDPEPPIPDLEEIKPSTLPIVVPKPRPR